MYKEFEIQLLTIDSVDEQIEVFANAFDNTTDIGVIKAKWIQKHFNCSEGKSYIFGAYDGEKLISINAYLPLTYCNNDVSVKVVESCESATLLEYRGMGVWSMIVQYAVDYFKEEGIYDAVIGFPNVENSYHGFMKMNWLDIQNMDNYLMVVNGTALAKSILKTNVKFVTKLLEFQHIKLLYRNYSFTVCDDEKLTMLESRGGCLKLKISNEFFLWKNSYKGLKYFSVVNQERKQVAMCFYYLEPFRNTSRIVLCKIEVFGNNYNTEMIYAFCIKYLIKKYNNAAYIRTWVPEDNGIKHILKQVGFIKAKHLNPFVLLPLECSDEKKAIIMDKNMWRELSFIDLD